MTGHHANIDAGARTSVRYLIRRLWHHLDRRRRRQCVLLLGLMLVSAVAEIVSLGTILPFIGVLAVPEKILQQPLGAALAGALGATTPDQLRLPLTIAFVGATLAAGIIRIFVIWLSTRLTFITGADISIEVYRRTLYQPYRVHIARNSSQMISGITAKVGHTTLGVLLPLLTLLSACVLIVAIMTALIVIDPLVASIAFGGFGLSYGLITWLSRRRLGRNSERIAIEHTRVVKALQEGLGGIRDVLLNGTQPVYCEVYRQADLRWRLAQGENVFIGQSPRFAMEALGMILIAALAFGISGRPGGLVGALPVLGALVLGAQRLLPALQQAYASWASIRGSYMSFVETIELLDQPLPEKMTEPPPAPMPLRNVLRVDNVGFRYAEDGPAVLADVNLEIPKGARVGFVGSTGSGKSTLMDLVMGLLAPSEGAVVIDDQALSGSNVRAWQQSVAHVPQSIFLADASLAQNIAFGVASDEIDMQRVRQAAQRAHIAEFIESGAGGYDALVGERGVRLSGGQRQRIGIARALYRRAGVLVLDEATSALDNETEKSVMEAIEELDRELTILIIAHRLTTVRHCDFVVELEQGRVVSQGSYEQLLQKSEGSARMALAAKTN